MENSDEFDNSLDFEILDQEKWEELTKAKIAARRELLSLPPTEAQKRVNNVLFPHLWKVDRKALMTWNESIPSPKKDDETNS
jgi:hypothetical protein